jgi:hypothetical protein
MLLTPIVRNAISAAPPGGRQFGWLPYDAVRSNVAAMHAW